MGRRPSCSPEREIHHKIPRLVIIGVSDPRKPDFVDLIESDCLGRIAGRVDPVRRRRSPNGIVEESASCFRCMHAQSSKLAIHCEINSSASVRTVTFSSGAGARAFTRTEGSTGHFDSTM